MDQATWTKIDAIAEQEAAALKRARRYRSAFYIQRQHSHTISRDQALFDEHLEIRYVRCSMCGRKFNPTTEQDDTNVVQPVSHQSVFTKDIDICNSCMYLKHRLLRPAPAVSTARAFHL